MRLERGSFPVIHAVTDTATVLHDGFLDRAGAVMRALGPRGALHLRSSRLGGRECHELATLLAVQQRMTGCWLIVNDRVDVALAAGAKGVQLASHSLRVREALAVSDELAVGASIHSVEEAIAAEYEGASWCVAGTVFETPSHQGKPPARIGFIEDVARAVSIPIIAIGGVHPGDVPALRKAGAHGVATIRGAAWNHVAEVSASADDMLKTRLRVRSDPGYSDPVTRYISAYDSDSGSDPDDNADGERNTTGARP